MNRTKLRIGEFSDLSQVSVKSLRYYDEIGLLKPAYTDRTTGYRYYSPEQLTRLNRILVFKGLGFSLKQIAYLLKRDLPAGELREMLRLRRIELERRLMEERGLLVQVENRLLQIEQESPTSNCEIVVKKIFPRLVASVRDTLSNYEEISELFDELNSCLKNSGKTSASAAIWHRCDLDNHKIDCEALLYLKNPVPNCGRVRVYELPAETAACTIYQDTQEDGNWFEAYNATQNWVESNNYRETGPRREVYLQTAQNHSDGFNLTEIQFPVEVRPAGI